MKNNLKRPKKVVNKEEKKFFEKYKCRIYEIIEQETQVERKEKTEMY